MRKEFAHGEAAKFARTYGYQKRVVSGVDAVAKVRAVEFGSSSDRVAKTEGGERLSEAPGVLPSFVLRHVLPLSVTLHKRDVIADDRVVDHAREAVAAEGDLAAGGQRIGAALRAAVKRDRFSEDLAGKPFGQLGQFASYYDRASADAGNCGDAGARKWESRYPDDVGGQLVAEAEGLPAGDLLPKERLLLEKLRNELVEGRNVLVFLWHKDLAARLLRLLSTVAPSVFLDADRVPARKRPEWIDKHVFGKKRVMLTNPTCVMTGLNNLIWFSTAWFHEDPGCNPFVARQAVGRLDRITQLREVRVFWPVYDGVQAAVLALLQSKTAISQQIDGIDPTAAMEMAGGGACAEAQAMDVGLAVYRALGGD